MEKTELPGSGRLKNLRSEGIFPYSRFSTTCFVVGFIILNLMIGKQSWKEISSAYGLLIQEGTLDNFTLLKKIFSNFTFLLILNALGTVLAILIGVLAQSRFHLSLAHINFDLGRVNPFRVLTFKGVLMRILKGLLVCMFALGSGIFFLWWHSHDIFTLLTKDKKHFINWPVTFYASSWSLLLAFLLFAALLSYWSVWYAFMLRHRVSRKELESNDEE